MAKKSKAESEVQESGGVGVDTKTVLDGLATVLELPERASIELKVSKFKWASEISGGSLEHTLHLTSNMTTEQRAELENLLLHYWELGCIISGTLRPQQAEMFPVEGFGEGGPAKDEADKEQPD